MLQICFILEINITKIISPFIGKTYFKIVAKNTLAHKSFGKPNIPLEIAGKEIEVRGGYKLSAISRLYK